MISINPEYEFNHELSTIENRDYRRLAILALQKIPAYFWTVPASSSGRYHPRTSLGIGGLVRHVKSVFAIAEILLSHPTLYSHFTPEVKDQIRVAILLHDCCKQGIKDDGTHTVHEHPLLPNQLLRFHIPEEYQDMWVEVSKLIETHMGPWNKDTKGGSDVVLPVPDTPEQQFVHMCDYLASKKEVEVDVFTRTAQDGYVAPSKPASENQVRYIRSLYDKLTNQGKDTSKWEGIELFKLSEETKTMEVVISSQDASRMITEMKEVLGWR